VLGFVVVVANTRRFYRRFVWRRGALGAVLVVPRLFNRRNVATVLNSLRYFPRAPLDDPPAELVAFVVREEAQGRGLGGTLFEATVLEGRRRGLAAIKVCTPTTNRGANRFYRNHGGQLIRTEPFNAEVEQNVYVVRLAGQGG
jgi:GNAT superfamily N-acetyltransferase